MKKIKVILKNNKITLVSIVLSLIGMGFSSCLNNQISFILWLICFAFCVSDFGWNIHDNKIKKLENKICELENKLK
jgi:hypothetical protein